jgi:hypothetical protein
MYIYNAIRGQRKTIEMTQTKTSWEIKVCMVDSHDTIFRKKYYSIYEIQGQDSLSESTWDI